MVRKTIEETLYLHALAHPEKDAILTINDRISFHDLFYTALAHAAFLQENGLKEKDVVVLRASNDIEYALLYLSIHLAHGIVCSLERTTPAMTLCDVADQMSAVFVLADDVSSEGHVWKILSRKVDRENKAERKVPPFAPLEDPADILFTTGTTGASKGVLLSQKALVATAENLIFGCGYEEDMLLVAPGPLNHANAIRKLFTSLINGNTIFLLNGMTNVRAFFQVLDLPYTHIACCLPPAMIRFILTVSKKKISEYQDKILFIESASAPLPEPDRLLLGEYLPKTRLIINYGSSEAASVTMYDCIAHPGLVNCIGKPMPNAEILVVDDNKVPIQSSQENVGLIACKGDVNMIEYVKSPELTAEVLIDGIVYTNDIGYIDENGFVYTIGRKGDVINVGGLKVAPTEVEEAALAFDGIDECICIAVPDRISGLAPKLLYVGEAELNVQVLTRFLAERLEAYKVPRSFEKVDEIRKTFNGKIDRKSYR